MGTIEKLAKYFILIEKIDYDNREGGRYAYVQFLSYTREILLVLHEVTEVENEIEAIENIHEVLNNNVFLKFEERQRIIFDAKCHEIKNIFENLKRLLKEQDEKVPGLLLLRETSVQV